MRKFILIPAILLAGLVTGAQQIVRLDKSAITAAQLETKIRTLMDAAHVQGLGIAVFNKNKPVYEKTFGYTRADQQKPLEINSNMYGASLSKAVFAVLVMKLVEEGKLSLDKPLQSYLDKPIYEYKGTKKWHDDYSSLRSDSLYPQITARMCLDHTTGFPNWRWDTEDQQLKVLSQPGKRYSYSGEGLVYLQVVLEHMLGKPLEEMMQEKLFRPLGMFNSSYTWQPRFEKDFAYGHKTDGALYEKDKDNDARSASTLETTFGDYTLFTQAVLSNSIISEQSRNEMFRLQIRIRSVQQFGPLRNRDTSANDHINLGYGLGWGLLKSPYGVAAFKEGHGDGFQHYTILFPGSGTGIVIMTNSDNGESIFKELLAYAIGDKYTPWAWQNYIPYNQTPTGTQSPVSSIFPPGTVVHANIPYAGDTIRKHQLDIYLPAGGKKSHPLLVWVHGGAWMLNDKYADMGYMQETIRGLVDRGYAIASIDYRHSTTAVFPAQVQDCNQALSFLYDNAARYNLDKNRIGLIGFSAGGHLASLMALSANNNISAFYKAGSRPVKVKCVLDFYGPSDFMMLASLPDSSINNDRNPVSILLGAMPVNRPDLARRASPVTYVDKNDPPFLIVQGEKDESVPNTQSIVLTSWLKIAGVKNELVMVPDAPHYGQMFDASWIREKLFLFLGNNLLK